MPRFHDRVVFVTAHQIRDKHYAIMKASRPIRLHLQFWCGLRSGRGSAQRQTQPPICLRLRFSRSLRRCDGLSAR